MSTRAEPPVWRQDDAAAMQERIQRWAAATIGPAAVVDGLERMPGHSGITWAFDVHLGGGTDGPVGTGGRTSGTSGGTSGSSRGTDGAGRGTGGSSRGTDGAGDGTRDTRGTDGAGDGTRDTRGTDGAGDGTRGTERLVLRVPPLGARRSAATDVHRQAPLLTALAEHGVPAPRVRWSGAHGPWFDTSYLVVDRVAGASPGDVFADGGAPAPPPAVFAEAMRVLARIHDTPPPSEWRPATPLTAVVDHWRKLLEETPEPSWVPAGRTLHARLRAAVPEAGPPGLVHADFYANNWMVSGGALVAVLDWEGAHRGDGRVDVGWIAMMYDRASWHPAQRPDIADAPDPEDLVAAYGAPLRDVAWFRALAAMRLAALTAHYLHMHRTGQRPDATWEAFGLSVPYLLARAVAVLDGA